MMTTNERLEELQTQLMFAEDSREWDMIFDHIQEIRRDMEIEVYHLSQIEK